MKTKISSAALVAEGKKLLIYIQTNTVPYVNNGMTLAGMDCQGLVEYLLIEAGVPKVECGLAGSNAHWRACTWRGTPEECIKKFGYIPEGAALFIHDNDGGEVARGYKDSYGNASHIGLVWGEYTSIAGSSSRGKVVESNFAGKTINGGWNMIGLLPWVDYGLAAEQETDTDNLDTGVPVAVDADSYTETTNLLVAQMRMYAGNHMLIKRGCKGAAVGCLQNGLITLGYDLKADNDFGPITQGAVLKFQESKQIEVDGIVGPITWSALISAYQLVITEK